MAEQMKKKLYKIVLAIIIKSKSRKKIQWPPLYFQLDINKRLDPAGLKGQWRRSGGIVRAIRRHGWLETA